MGLETEGVGGLDTSGVFFTGPNNGGKGIPRSNLSKVYTLGFGRKWIMFQSAFLNKREKKIFGILGLHEQDIDFFPPPKGGAS